MLEIPKKIRSYSWLKLIFVEPPCRTRAGDSGEEGGGGRGKSVRDGAGDGSLASQANENEERKKSKDGAKTPKRATLQKVL